MSTIQTQDGIRYLRRKNLEEESRVMGNYYRDIIRQYGLDCTYYKLNTDFAREFKPVIDRNTILRRAYGYEITPDYRVSADMITFAEVDQDIFNLNKFGIIPQTEITFYFDSTQFACDMAPKLGQLKEYKIAERDITAEVPDPESLSDVFILGEDDPIEYRCDMLSGLCQCVISSYEYDKEYSLVCDPYEHTDFYVEFDANSDLYHSLKYRIQNDDYLETLIYLKFTVKRVQTAPGEFKNILTGKMHGSVLFFDIERLNKYAGLIHPEVGDVIEIDFPDENNREKYEITDCFDKSLGSDGINPLLHKYIWKCKAVRYTNSHEELAPPDNEADKRIQEKMDYDAVVDEEVAEKVSMYDKISDTVSEDAVYGGYDLSVDTYDKYVPKPSNHEKYDYLDMNTAIDIMRFGCGSRLVTDGYDLIFVDVNGDSYLVTMDQTRSSVPGAVFESGTKWLKATDDAVTFVNVAGDWSVIAQNEYATQRELQVCLDSMCELTVDPNKREINGTGDNFLKFNGTRTVIWANEYNLYIKLAGNERLYVII